MSHHTSETGQLIIVSGDTETPVYAQVKGGILHCMVRATDKDTFDTMAINVGLLVHENPAIPEMVDVDGNVIRPAEPASGDYVPAPGATITRIGPHVIIPAVVDDEGNVTTPPVMDTRYHANFWLPATQGGAWEALCVQWMASGADGQANAAETGKVFQGIELIDPLSICSPANVLL